MPSGLWTGGWIRLQNAEVPRASHGTAVVHFSHDPGCYHLPEAILSISGYTKGSVHLLCNPGKLLLVHAAAAGDTHTTHPLEALLLLGSLTERALLVGCHQALCPGLAGASLVRVSAG